MSVLEGGAPTPQSDLVKDTTTKTFREDVLTESVKQPVLVDFWAPWCGPCKQLQPIIEKVVKAAGGKVKLVKMNIDENPEIAGQLGIQSIPAVIAFQRGQPVDGFMGALPESQVKGFIERLIGPLGPGAAEELIAQALEAQAQGDAAGAAALYATVLAQEPDNVAALAGLARVELDSGNIEGARGVLAAVPDAKKNDPAIASVLAAIELTEKSASLGDTAEFEAKIAQNANDHQARFDLAMALAARDKRDEAVDHLIEIIKRDRTWDEDGARRQLLQFFEAWGPMDETSIAGRRKLSAVLFR
ncbi:MAG: thioredoxin [Beijerinckiaceae bacterium]|nr:thioredoxin [Beijerinckiaceae bacterium]